ncbi:MAG: sulfatase-like hydrolase/transferase [Candidatus Eremiobacteraeota bacterium]|nr:sulfatase-like hydrolase/transferase [Candidatus Eremiobacteraeota bacterium]MCW5872419.1 sulfatase-like hydrolase/transferase [Candidatus Eremiobacteraeota bacterium]
MNKKLSRKSFLEMALAAVGGAVVAPTLLASGCSSDSASQGFPGGAPGADNPLKVRPNILLVLMDEFRLPPKYPDNSGEIPDLRQVLGFSKQLSPNNSMTRFFEGMMRLRKNAIVLRNHYVASAACVPSRSSLLTGQYPTVHGVTSTTGIFKEGSDPGFVFLDPNGIPTIGDWFQAAGYTTHYFGKWHVSEACDDLGPWGFPFGAWDGPEPHGSNPASMGVYRDPKFASDAADFLKSKGTAAPDEKPWFAVASLTNPHDVSNWPIPWFLPQGRGVQDAPADQTVIPPIPAPGAISNPVTGAAPPFNTASCPPPDSGPVPLNPDGFPQFAYNAPPTLHEDLSSKPRCHAEMAIKLGLALKSIQPEALRSASALPYPLNPKGDEWLLAYGQWWTYLHYLSDLNMRRVLQALDESGLTDNTIVVFTCDHGDYAGSHGGQIQKWHSAYEESIHVPMVVSSPLLNPSADTMLELTQPTSHIDLLPTLLGLAGFGKSTWPLLASRIPNQDISHPLVGSDLSAFVRSTGGQGPIPGNNGEPRPGVLFMAADAITEMTTINPQNEGFEGYGVFLDLVEQTRQTVTTLTPGPIAQPNRIRSLMTGDWKYSRYFDPTGGVPQEFELYHLPTDPTESINLVDFQTGNIRAGASVPGLTDRELEAQKQLLAAQLAAQEAALL